MQEELDDILRYGAMELFSEKDEDGKARQIHYDDAAIDRFFLYKLAHICRFISFPPLYYYTFHHVSMSFPACNRSLVLKLSE